MTPTPYVSSLSIVNLAVSYGPHQIFKHLTLEIACGKISCMLGSNGAGKSTLLKAIMGTIPTQSGTISFNGQSLQNQTPEQRVCMGITLSPEGHQVFESMTILENLKIGAFHSHKKVLQSRLQEVLELFKELTIANKLHQKAGTLSGGEQQMLAIARAMMSKPKLLLLDEPTLGVSPLITQEIFKILQIISQQGVTILMAEQNALLSLKASDYGFVLELGNLKAQGSATSLLKHEHIQKFYLGGDL